MLDFIGSFIVNTFLKESREPDEAGGIKSARAPTGALGSGSSNFDAYLLFEWSLKDYLKHTQPVFTTLINTLNITPNTLDRF